MGLLTVGPFRGFNLSVCSETLPEVEVSRKYFPSVPERRSHAPLADPEA